MHNCIARGTVICRNLNRGKDEAKCDLCDLRRMDESELKDLIESFAITQSLLPESGVDYLLDEDECLLCRGEKNKKTCYGTINFCHAEPPGKKRPFFGLGKMVRTKIGSIVPVSFASCDSCRRRVFSLSFSTMASILAFVILGIILAVIPPITNLLNRIFYGAPFILIILLGIVGYFFSRPIAESMRKRMGSKIYLDIFEIPIFADMKTKGWFLMDNDKENKSDILFAKKKPYLRFDMEKADKKEIE